MKQLLNNTLFRLVVGIVLGLLVGGHLNATSIQPVLSLKHVLGQVIHFFIPLIVVGFVAASITKLTDRSSGVFGFALLLAYGGTVAAAGYATLLAYGIIPQLDIPRDTVALRELPMMVFRLDIPSIFPVMTALVLAFFLGLGALWTQARNLERVLDELRDIVSLLIKRVLIPIIPVFVALNFAVLSYEGVIQRQLPVFLTVVLLVILAHFVWLAFVYGVAALITKRNPWPLIKHYPPTYFTAMGTMSSMATLAVALDNVRASRMLKPDLSNFTIPFFASIHLCGSVIAIVFLGLSVSQVLYGSMPAPGTMLLFIFLLAIFAVSAPGVPGGTVIASLGLITSVLGFDEAGLALLLSIFALQDSFGTATNITSDGALAMITEAYQDRREVGS